MMRSVRILSRYIRAASVSSVRPLASWAPKAGAATRAPPLQALAVIRRHGLLLQRRASWVAPHTEVAVVSGGKRLTVKWADGETKTYHAAWLRHNCRCPACWDPTSGQKVLPDSQLSGKLTVTTAESDGMTLSLHWTDGNTLEHSGFVNLYWLRDNSYSPEDLRKRMQRSRPPYTASLPEMSYSEISRSEQGVWRWLHELNEYGACVLTDVPAEEGRVREVASLMGPIQHTHYGEVFDVMAKKRPLNIAFTTRSLPLHTDLVYLEAPPGIQLLHCIRNDPCVEGGETIVLDGFAVVEQLRRSFPVQFNTLTRTPVTFDKIQAGKVLRHRRPHIMLDSTGEVAQINWSPQNHGPLFIAEEDIEPYYEAYKCLATLLHESELKLSHLLQPGDMLTFNNRRCLHSRNEFKLNGGVRHLQLAYVSTDDFKSKVRVLAPKYNPEFSVKTVFNSCTF